MAEGSDTEGAEAGWPEVTGYVVRAQIGSGGFATVFRAHQTSVGRDVALKVLDARRLDATGQRRFRTEARAIGALSDHEHVVDVFDVGMTRGGHPYIAMRLLPDGSFGDRVRADGPLPASTVIRIGREVTDALAAAHAHGIVHRDIKPDNILIGRRGTAQLSDFGIATLDDGTRTTTGTITGTVAYTAPEVIAGQRATASSDVFSLGATLHHLLGGRGPFSGPSENVVTVMWRVANEAPHPLPDAVPADLADLVTRCLAKDPADRPGLVQVDAALDEISQAPQPPTPALGPIVVATAPDPTVTAAHPAPGGDSTATVATPPSMPDRSDEPTLDPADDMAIDGQGRDGPTDTSPRRTALVVLGALVVLILVAAATWALARDDGADEKSADGNGETTTTDAEGSGSTTPSPSTSTQPALVLPEPVVAEPTFLDSYSPSSIAVSADAVVTVLNGTEELVHYDRVTGEERDRYDVPGAQQVALAFGSAWVARGFSSSVTRIDLTTGEQRDISTGDGGSFFSQLTPAASAVWITLDVEGDVSTRRISPDGNVGAPTALPETPLSFASIGEDLWFLDSQGLGQVVGETGELVRPSVDLGPLDELGPALAASDGNLLLSASDYPADGPDVNVLLRFDSGAGIEILGTISDYPIGMVAPRNGGAVWVQVSDDLGELTLIRVDPGSATVTVELEVDDNDIYALAASDDDLWFSTESPARFGVVTAP